MRGLPPPRDPFPIRPGDQETCSFDFDGERCSSREMFVEENSLHSESEHRLSKLGEPAVIAYVCANDVDLHSNCFYQTLAV